MIDEKLYPYTVQYIKKYGLENAISTFEVPAYFGSPEELYKYCLKKNIEWQDIIKKTNKNTTL